MDGKTGCLLNMNSAASDVSPIFADDAVMDDENAVKRVYTPTP